jgi:tripartite-type tricarboxylate transporter receptor subunit TctC
MADLLGGSLAMSVLPLGSVLGTIQAGRLRALAVASEVRTPLLPDVPTMPEAGFPDNVVVSWYGLHAPSGTPDAAISALVAAARAATADAEVREAATRAGGETAFLDRAGFAGFLAEDRARWERTVAALKAG